MDFLILLLLTLHQTRAAENVFQLRGAYSLRESASGGDGTGITSGPCLSVNSAHAYVDLINQMNAGKGFEVYSNIWNETSYFQLNYTFKTYTRSADSSLEAWLREGLNASTSAFADADFIIGNSAACYDLETIEQAVLATKMNKLYFMSRGPTRILEEVQRKTQDLTTRRQNAFSIHVSSDQYPQEILMQAALRRYKTVSIIHEESDNFFFSKNSAAHCKS